MSATERDTDAPCVPADPPEWCAPMLATLTHDHFSDPGWIYERKLDGERALAFRNGGELRLMTRNRKRIEATYPELIDALAAQPVRDFVADGEIVAFSEGVSDFSRLQSRMQIKDPDKARASGVTVHFYLFDLLHVDGRDITGLPQRERKAILRDAFAFEDPVRYTPHRNEDGEAYLAEACRKGWEGIIAKRADAPYAHSRSRDWLKFKCSAGQELVIGGFTEPKGSRIGFGALLLGYYDAGALRYAGKVGTGFDDDFLAAFRDRLDGILCEASPFADDVNESGAHWVAPEIVAEIGFTEWTSGGKLRHPRFLGLRRDKAAGDVVREA